MKYIQAALIIALSVVGFWTLDKSQRYRKISYREEEAHTWITTITVMAAMFYIISLV